MPSLARAATICPTSFARASGEMEADDGDELRRKDVIMCASESEEYR